MSIVIGERLALHCRDVVMPLLMDKQRAGTPLSVTFFGVAASLGQHSIVVSLSIERPEMLVIPGHYLTPLAPPLTTSEELDKFLQGASVHLDRDIAAMLVVEFPCLAAVEMDIAQVVGINEKIDVEAEKKVGIEHHITIFDRTNSWCVGTPMEVASDGNGALTWVPREHALFLPKLSQDAKLTVFIGSTFAADKAPPPHSPLLKNFSIKFSLMLRAPSDCWRIAVSVFQRMASIPYFSGHHVEHQYCWPAEVAVPVLAPVANLVMRKELHKLLLLPNRPRLTPANVISIDYDTFEKPAELLSRRSDSGEPQRHGAQWEKALTCCPHLHIQKSVSIEGAKTAVVRGSYDYYHYRIDGFNDDGWGCAYRSLQTVLSWFQYAGIMLAKVPSVLDIQRILCRVDYGKHEKKGFVGSKEWIGSYEVMMVINDFMPAMECTLKRLEKGEELETNAELHRLLLSHFEAGGCPVMIGGSSYAHTILGIEANIRTSEVQYLVLDPHYSSSATDMKVVKGKGWCGWKKASKFFEPTSFYNLCIPRVTETDFS